MPQRPNNFTLNIRHPLAKSLVFAGLGAHAGSTRYHDSSAYGNAGTLTLMDPSVDWVWSDKLNRFALDFDGSNDYVNGPAIASCPVFSLTWWGKCTSTSSSYVTIAGWGATYSGLIVYGSANVNAGRIAHLKSDGNISGTWNAAWVDQTSWHCFTYLQYGITSALAELYRDGSLVTGGGTLVTSAATIVKIGEFSTLLGNEFKGQMSDVLMHSRVISPAEIQQLADPSNVMLSGLINAPRRKWWPVVAGGAPATSSRRRRLICSGY